MQYGVVMFSEWDAEGFLGIQIDAQGEGSASTVEVAHPFGFLGRPHDPDANGLGCSVEVRELGSEQFAWIGHDPRSVAWLPRVTKGGAAQYGGPLAKSLTWREIDGTTGSITDYVPTAWDSNGTATAAHKLEIGVDGSGAPIAQLLHSDGSLLALFDGAATLADSTGGGFVEVKGGKITLNGSTKVVGGLDVGGTGGVAVTLYPALKAACETALATFATFVPAPHDGGAAAIVKVAAAFQALITALAAAESTMTKTI